MESLPSHCIFEQDAVNQPQRHGHVYGRIHNDKGDANTFGDHHVTVNINSSVHGPSNAHGPYAALRSSSSCPGLKDIQSTQDNSSQQSSGTKSGVTALHSTNSRLRRVQSSPCFTCATRRWQRHPSLHSGSSNCVEGNKRGHLFVRSQSHASSDAYARRLPRHGHVGSNAAQGRRNAQELGDYALNM